MSDFARQTLALTLADSPQSLWNTLAEALQSYGFSRISYGFSRSRHGIGAGIPLGENDIFLTNLPFDGNTHTIAVFLMRTPMFRWILQNNGACSWHWAEEQRRAGLLSPEECEAQDIARRAGLSAGYVISMTDEAACSRGGFSLSGDIGVTQSQIDQIWDQHGAQIQALCNVMHLKMRSFPMPSLRRPLSPRQLEALQWVAEGKTSQDIATIMGVTPAMVEKHLRLAREALDVETTAHAVAKAALHNYLFAARSPLAQQPSKE